MPLVFTGKEQKREREGPRRRKGYFNGIGRRKMQKDLTGARVEVYWSDDEEYYEGAVTKRRSHGSFYFVEYSDGDKEWVSPKMSKFKVVKGRSTLSLLLKKRKRRPLFRS